MLRRVLPIICLLLVFCSISYGQTGEQKPAGEQKPTSEQNQAGDQNDQKAAGEQKPAGVQNPANDQKAADDGKAVGEKKPASEQIQTTDQKAASEQNPADEQKPGELQKHRTILEEETKDTNKVSESKSVIPEGTELQLMLKEPISSKLSEPGDVVTAVLRRDVVVDGYKLLTEGTEFIGRVTLAQPARRPLKGGQLHLTFEKVRIDGQEQKLYALIKSASDFRRDDKFKSDSEGTLKAGSDGGKVFDNMVKAGTLGGVGASIIILSSIHSNGGIGGISRAAAIGGPAVFGGSMVAGILLTKGKEI
ncbi:MAG: hypothetical protein J2P41_23075, partial [Blastocatellia bacterium]|nr:hypothetical protein [Blastocatellia bacterium]